MKNWIEELRSFDDPQIIFQPWKMPEDKKHELGLAGNEWVEQPLKRIEFHVARNAGRGRDRGKGGRAGGSRGGGGGGGNRGGFHGRGRAEKSRGQARKGRVDKMADYNNDG